MDRHASLYIWEMEMDRYLIMIVTLSGLLLSAMCFVIIFRGKRIPGDTGSNQELEYKGFKMRTNAVVMLLIVSAVVMVLPLSLQAWLVSHPPVTPPAPSQPQEIYITGQVLDTKGSVEGAKVTVVNMKDAKPGDQLSPLDERMTDGNGAFEFPALPFGKGDRYKVVAAKEGHIEQYFYMGPSGAVNVRTVLVAKPKNGGGQ